MKCSLLVFVGKEVGVIVTTSLAGVLCASNFLGGWPSAFYVFGKNTRLSSTVLCF